MDLEVPFSMLHRPYRCHPMTTHFVLLPSPLLGPAVWEPVATELRRSGQVVTVVALQGAVRSPVDVLEGFYSSLPDEPVVLVPHSNAGLFMPALAARSRVLATVFVDAALPPAEARTTTPASAAFFDWLAPKADAFGVLPVWTQWWDEEEVIGLFPDATTQESVEGQQQHLPLAYFAEPLTVPQGWDAAPCAYLAFGDTYAEETRAARERGWPVTVTSGSHLEMLSRPARVAQHVRRLADEVRSADHR